MNANEQLDFDPLKQAQQPQAAGGDAGALSGFDFPDLSGGLELLGDIASIGVNIVAGGLELLSAL